VSPGSAGKRSHSRRRKEEFEAAARSYEEYLTLWEELESMGRGEVPETPQAR
ncbi:hypothetical protein CLOM_g23317, partial [Closterium sp. NIES-68]